MRRNCIVPPIEDESYEYQLALTILDQAHLLPIPFTIRPIFWAYDHALRLYPQPHLVNLSLFSFNFTSLCWLINVNRIKLIMKVHKY